MKYVVNFFAFWYDFIVGDDWRLALGTVIGLGACWYCLAYSEIDLWWLMPLVVLASLSWSLRRAIHKP